jgi:hypothetical protein
LKYLKIHFKNTLETLTLIVILRVMVQNTSEILCIPLSCLIPFLSPSPFSRETNGTGETNDTDLIKREACPRYVRQTIVIHKYGVSPMISAPTNAANCDRQRYELASDRSKAMEEKKKYTKNLNLRGFISRCNYEVTHLQHE